MLPAQSDGSLGWNLYAAISSDGTGVDVELAGHLHRPTNQPRRQSRVGFAGEALDDRILSIVGRHCIAPHARTKNSRAWTILAPNACCNPPPPRTPLARFRPDDSLAFPPQETIRCDWLTEPFRPGEISLKRGRGNGGLSPPTRRSDWVDP
jgi:hypothetical protein